MLEKIFNSPMCSDIESVSGLFTFEFAPPLLLYTYIPISILLLILSIYLLIKRSKDLGIRLFVVLSVLFVIWSFNEIYQWIAVYSSLTHFSWQLNILISSLIITLIYYLVHFFSRNSFPGFKTNLVFFVANLPFILLLAHNLNVYEFDLYICGPTQGVLWNYFYIFSSVVFILSVVKIFSSKNKQSKVLGISLSVFLLIYFLSILFGDITLLYELNLLGPIGIVGFLIALFYSIGKYKLFNIKILLPTILVFLLLFLNFAMLFIRTIDNIRIILSITLILTAGIGYILVRSVRKIEKQRVMLDEANKNQQSLIHFITHQVKGYLTKSRNIFYGILEGDYGKVSKKIKEVSQHGFDSQTNGVITVQNVLKASDLKRGSVEFKKIDFDVKTLVEDLIQEFKDSAKNKGLELKTDIEQKIINIKGDRMSIKEVFRNLIDNAIVYTSKGFVEVSLEGVGDKVKFSVKDSGAGLTEEDKKSLFTQGGRGEESIKYNVDTSGYGLYIAKQMVEKHGGEIFAESEGRDKGSTFTVILSK